MTHENDNPIHGRTFLLVARFSCVETHLRNFHVRSFGRFFGYVFVQTHGEGNSCVDRAHVHRETEVLQSVFVDTASESGTYPFRALAGGGSPVTYTSQWTKACSSPRCGEWVARHIMNLN